jgi:RNA polymerase-binding protein DksA
MAARTAVKSRTKKTEKAKVRPRTSPQRTGRGAAKSSKDVARFRELLLTERGRLESELREIESRTARVTESERASELSGYEDHPADIASETFEREKDLAIGESVETLLNQVITALEKVDRGTYGVCDACGRPIKKARLEALPFATLCLDCQDRMER